MIQKENNQFRLHLKKKEDYTAPRIEVIEVEFSLPVMAMTVPGEWG